MDTIGTMTQPLRVPPPHFDRDVARSRSYNPRRRTIGVRLDLTPARNQSIRRYYDHLCDNEDDGTIGAFRTIGSSPARPLRLKLLAPSVVVILILTYAATIEAFGPDHPMWVERGIGV